MDLGCGDFGKAWDRNLSDEDGPYIELMTGVFTDNQPDFTWLKPFEEKTFKQYFMPYKVVGQVKNATTEAILHLSYDGEKAKVIVYATGIYENANIVLTAAGQKVLDETVKISPVDVFEMDVRLNGIKEEELCLSAYAEGNCLVSYRPEAADREKSKPL